MKMIKILFTHVIVLLLFTIIIGCKGQQSNDSNLNENVTGVIRTDQLGYRRIGIKQAIVADIESKTFAVKLASNDETVFTGELSASINAPNAGETVRIADFSNLEEHGEYYVITAAGRSHPFLIADKPYGDLRLAILEMFNYQKCGVNLSAGRWSHPACHAKPAEALYKK